MRLLAVLMFALVAAAPSAALAQAAASPTEEAGVRLVWNAPEGCPAADAVTAQVERNLSGSRPVRAEARADVTMRAPEDWSVRIVTRAGDTTGERSFEADSCVAVATGTALIVALAFEPPSQADPVADPLPLRVFPPIRSTPPESPAARPASSGAAVEGVLAVSAQGDVGTLPGPGAAMEIAGGVVLGRFRVEASGSDWLDQNALRTTTEGAHLHLLEGALRGCWRAVVGSSIEAAPCLGAAVARLSSDGFGETTPYQGSAAWYGTALGGLLATWKLPGPFALRANAGVSVPFAAPPVVILDEPGGTVSIHHPSAVAGRAALGLEVRFP